MQRIALFALAFVACLGLGAAQMGSGYNNNNNYGNNNYGNNNYGDYNKKVGSLKCPNLKQLLGVWKGACIQAAAFNASVVGGGIAITPSSTNLSCLAPRNVMSQPIHITVTSLGGGYDQQVQVEYSTQDTVTLFNDGSVNVLPAVNASLIFFPQKKDDYGAGSYGSSNSYGSNSYSSNSYGSNSYGNDEKCCFKAINNTMGAMMPILGSDMGRIQKFNLFLEQFGEDNYGNNYGSSNYGNTRGQHLIIEAIGTLADGTITDICPEPGSDYFCSQQRNRYYIRCDVARIPVNVPSIPYDNYGSMGYNSYGYKK